MAPFPSVLLTRRHLLAGAAATATLLEAPSRAYAEGRKVVKIGMIQSMTGPFSAVGKATVNGARLYMQQHGDTLIGRNIQLAISDDASAPDVAKRLAQEMIVNDNVALIAPGITPCALAIAPLATEARIPVVVMVSGASTTLDRSPFMVRTSFTTGQSSKAIAEWATRNGAKRIATLVSDWTPGLEAEAVFSTRVSELGAKVIATGRVPVANPDFAPYLQRARDVGPDTVFVVLPVTQAGVFAKQFVERGLDKSGIRIVGGGDITDDDELPGMADAMLGIVTAHHYSVLHDTATNRAFVKDFESAFGHRPNYMAVGGWDGMHLIYQALQLTSGNTQGEALLAAMKGMAWESPRGPMSIDPQTRDIVQNEYIRKVEKVNGQLYNVEFETFEAVRDPVRSVKK